MNTEVPGRANKKPRHWAGLYSGAKQLGFQFPFQGSGQADQTSSDQGQAAGFRHDNVGVAARNRGRAIEGALSGGDRQLDRRAENRAPSFPGAGNGSGERVVVGSIGQVHD